MEGEAAARHGLVLGRDLAGEGWREAVEHEAEGVLGDEERGHVRHRVDVRVPAVAVLPLRVVQRHERKLPAVPSCAQHDVVLRVRARGAHARVALRDEVHPVRLLALARDARRGIVGPRRHLLEHRVDEARRVGVLQVGEHRYLREPRGVERVDEARTQRLRYVRERRLLRQVVVLHRDVEVQPLHDLALEARRHVLAAHEGAHVA